MRVWVLPATPRANSWVAGAFTVGLWPNVTTVNESAWRRRMPWCTVIDFETTGLFLRSTTGSSWVGVVCVSNNGEVQGEWSSW